MDWSPLGADEYSKAFTRCHKCLRRLIDLEKDTHKMLQKSKQQAVTVIETVIIAMKMGKI